MGPGFSKRSWANESGPRIHAPGQPNFELFCLTCGESFSSNWGAGRPNGCHAMGRWSEHRLHLGEDRPTRLSPPRLASGQIKFTRLGEARRESGQTHGRAKSLHLHAWTHRLARSCVSLTLAALSGAPRRRPSRPSTAETQPAQHASDAQHSGDLGCLAHPGTAYLHRPGRDKRRATSCLPLPHPNSSGHYT